MLKKYLQIRKKAVFVNNIRNVVLCLSKFQRKDHKGDLSVCKNSISGICNLHVSENELKELGFEKIDIKKYKELGILVEGLETPHDIKYAKEYATSLYEDVNAGIPLKNKVVNVFEGIPQFQMTVGECVLVSLFVIVLSMIFQWVLH